MTHRLSINMHTQSAYEASLAQNGRTFHWARRFLGHTHGTNAARLYAFCRLLDDLADGDLPNGATRLQAISQDLNALEADNFASITDPDMGHFAPFMKAQGLSYQALRHLIDGLLFDQGEVQLADEAALITYGYQVAGTVGMMMCPVLSCHDEQATDFAIDLGIAMQLTNIARDVLEDAKMGRRYLPGSWVKGASPEAIYQGAMSHDEPMVTLIQTALDKTLSLAERYYQSGLSGLAYLPKRAQFAIAVAALSYRQIGVQLRKQGMRWHEGRTVTSRLTKARLSLTALPVLLPQRLPASHNSALHQALRGYAK